MVVPACRQEVEVLHQLDRLADLIRALLGFRFSYVCSVLDAFRSETFEGWEGASSC